MTLIGRLFVILFAFLAACLVAGMIVVGAVLFPEFSDLGSGPIDPGALNIVLGFGFIFISGFALLPAMIVAAITEAFYVRSALAYAIGGGLVGFVAGVVYWMIAGRNAGAWREPPRPLTPPPPLPSHSTLSSASPSPPHAPPS